MPIQVTCDECGESFSARDEAAGKRVKCRACGAPVRVPDDVEDYDAPPARPARRANRPAAKGGSGASTVLWVLLGGGLFLIVLCVGIGLFIVGKVRKAADNALRDNPVNNPAPPVVVPGPLGEPKVPPVPWSAKADPATTPVAWPETLAGAISVKLYLPQIVFPTRPSTFVATSLAADRSPARIWDVGAGAQVAMMKSETGNGEAFVLSPDGQHLAVLAHGNHALHLWSAKTGEKLTPGEVTGKVSTVDFAGPGEAVVWTEDKKLYVVDANTGKVLHSADALEPKFGGASIAVSPGGKYVALGADDGTVHLHEVATARLVGAMFFPGNTVHYRVNNIAFSFDGTQLASFVQESNKTSLVVCDMNTGATDVAYSIAGDVSKFLDRTYSYRGAPLAALPNGRGWLLYGAFVLDNKSQQIVWTFPYHEADILPTGRQPGSGSVIALGGLKDNRQFKAYPIPWDKIDAALAGANPADALFASGTKARLQVQLGALAHGGPVDATKSLIEQAVRTRLASQRIEVAEDATLPIVRVEYREQAGPEMQFFGGAQKTNVPSTIAMATVSILSPDGTKPLFKHEVKIDAPSIVFNVQPTPLGIREKTLEDVKSRLQSLPLPLFIPKDPSGFTVPGTTPPN